MIFDSSMNILELKQKLLSSKLFKDSFWAVFGNGVGNCLLLIAGIIIARLLGKDLYGEYGMVKTTMFHIASFSTLGLGFTSTKFIADAVQNHPNRIKSIIKSSLGATLLFSVFLCVLLIISAERLAFYIEEPSTAPAFRALGLIVVFRALNTVSAGVLAGFKSFKRIGINSIISGSVLLVLSSFLTYKYGIVGSFIALALSQFVNAALNMSSVLAHFFSAIGDEEIAKEVIRFTLPVAIQEFSYMLCIWGGTLLLTKYASLGDVGLWSAASQWNAIILFIPQLLSNVILSYLSGLSKHREMHSNVMRKMLLINFICSFLPFIIIYLLAGFITSFYGPTFIDLKYILRVLTLSTIFMCLSNVYQSDLLSKGKNWLLLTLRVIRDMLMLFLLWLVLRNGVISAALAYSWIYVIIYFIYYILMIITQKSINRREIISIESRY